VKAFDNAFALLVTLWCLIEGGWNSRGGWKPPESKMTLLVLWTLSFRFLLRAMDKTLHGGFFLAPVTGNQIFRGSGCLAIRFNL